MNYRYSRGWRGASSGGIAVAKTPDAMKKTKSYLTDAQLVRRLLDSPWEQLKRESMRSELKFWLCTDLVAPRPASKSRVKRAA